MNILKKDRFNLLFLALTWLGGLISFCCFSQEKNIQWATGIEYQQNYYSQEGEWSGYSVLGKPDAIPQGRLSPNAFRLNDKSAFGTIILSYETPIEADFLIISENFNPGKVIEVFLFDEEDTRYPAYLTTANKPGNNFQILIIDIPRTSYAVSKIELNINTISDPGWSQIDAVGISNAALGEIKNELESYGLLNFKEEFGFIEAKKRLGPHINTAYDENKPIISPDGNYLYFIRNNYPGNIGGKRDAQDIYISTRHGKEWGQAENAGPDLNSRSPNGISSISPDGNIIYLINNYAKKGESSGGISYSYKTETGWTQPILAEMDGYYNRSDYEDHQVSANGRILISSLQRDDSYGNQDLYISFLEDRVRWSEPINLGPVINTPKVEFSPFLAPDGRTLYFASNGREGFGNSDIYFSRRLDESWMNWSQPQNMGSAINSHGTDAYYSVSARGDYGYFISNVGSANSSRDIFRIKLPTSVAPDPVLLVSGNVYDKKTNKPLGAQIYFESLSNDFDEGTALANSVSGAYTMVLTRGKVYGYRAEMEGYMGVNENIDLSSFNSYAEINKDLYLVPLEVGQLVRLNNLFFQRSSADVMSESFIELERWVETMKKNAELTIELLGHTDNQGNAKANYELSLLRVENVKQYFVSRGIKPDRVRTKGLGGSKPLNDNSTEELRVLNRRVELRIINI